jgi:hypothetical protein
VGGEEILLLAEAKPGHPPAPVVSILYVRSSPLTHPTSVTKTNRLMLFSEISDVCDDHLKHETESAGQMQNFLSTLRCVVHINCQTNFDNFI